MGSRKVGFVTLGQSPRTDVLDDLRPFLEHLEILERGALDDLSNEGLGVVAPAPGEIPYVSRLRNGAQVLLSKERILPLLQRAVEAVVQGGARAVVVLCTGSFPSLRCPVPILLPDRLLRNFVDGVLPGDGRLGVLVPHADQVSMACQAWRAIAHDVRVLSISPYVGFDEGVERCRALEACDLVAMDCLGYTQKQKRMAKAILPGVPVVLARTVVARAIQELT